MTIDTERTQQYTIADLCLMAARKAGIRNKHQGLDVATGRQAMAALELRVRQLQAKGMRAREKTFHALQLTEGTDRYVLPATVLDVFGTAMFVSSSETDVDHAASETPIEMESREEWQTSSTKAATGRPVKYYPHREGDLIEVRLWPIPDDSGTVRFQVHQKAANSTAGLATPDFEVVWQLCLVHWVAADLAIEDSKDTNKVTLLVALAKGYEAECLAFSRQRGPQQAVVSHDTGYR